MKEIGSKVENIAPPSALCEVQGLLDGTTNVEKAAEQNDLATVAKNFQAGAELVKQLIPKLTDLPELQQVYENILKVNIRLNRKLACNKADFNDVAQFLKFIINTLGPAVSSYC